jgi:hypothetical protein
MANVNWWSEGENDNPGKFKRFWSWLCDPKCSQRRCFRAPEYYFELDDLDVKTNEIVTQSIPLCSKHASGSGFCLGCGGFFAGVDDFEGDLCFECKDQFNRDIGAYDEYSDCPDPY